jgi:molecular chaperone DnaK
VIPAGAPPSPVRITRAELEELLRDARARLAEALPQAVARLGFKPEHIDHVLLAGGGARWWFAREAVRAALGIVPRLWPRPEETAARGLAVAGLTLGRP